MKQALAFLAVVCAAGITWWFVSDSMQARHQKEIVALQETWDAEKRDLENQLAQSRRLAASPAFVPAPARLNAPEAPKPDAAEIIKKLYGLKAVPGSNRLLRQAIQGFEELIAMGEGALPAIREFLLQSLEIDYTPAGQFKFQKDGVPQDFVTPPSLRFGLFDVVAKIGGAEAEKLLGDILATTGRGVEVAWLARSLQDSVPNKYRDTAISAARELLLRPPQSTGSPLDAREREQLFGVLAMYGDTSFAHDIKNQLVNVDGSVDAAAVGFLLKSLGREAVPIAAQAFSDPRITDPGQKEPFARLTLNFVGVDPEANAFYAKAVNDLTLSDSHRQNLIEDLNQDGFTDRKNLGESNLPMIENRIRLIDRLAAQNTDQANAAAYKEARKDLVNMREKIVNPPVVQKK